MRPLPLLLVGDSPRRTTGLARIARDLVQHLKADIEAGELALLLAQAGPDTGVGRQWGQWPFYGLPAEGDDWGAEALGQVYREAFGNLPGIVLTVWDPARCFALLQGADLPQGCQWWGYFPIDAQTRQGGFGGPAGEAVRRYDRVLAYGRWGSRVLQCVRGGTIPYLPHGIDRDTFTPELEAEEYAEAREILGHRVEDDTLLLGCVAANQPRKDLGLWMETLATMKDRGWPVHGWLHTDVLVKAGEFGWSIPELVSLTGAGRFLTVTTQLTDRQLAALYSLCSVTIAPGLGEGFGYPIVESLACGTPVIHGTYGGGAELVPRAEWKVPVRAERLEGIYAVKRPVYLAEDVANAVERAIRWRQLDEGVAREYCRGAVAHLDWATLWPRWRSWVRQGLREF